MARPLKFGEPLKNRQFRLPESLSEQLDKASKGRDVSDVVREAIEEKIARSPEPTAAQLVSSVREEMREAVTDALRENGVLSLACNPAASTQSGVVPHGVFVKANAGQLAQLAEMGDETGLGAPEDILSALMRQVLQMRPEQLQTLLVGNFGQTAIRTPRAAPSQKPKKKAA